MHELSVDLGDRSYPIFTGSELFSDPEYLQPYIHGQQVCVVTNETIAPLYLQQLKEVLGDKDILEIVLPDGERYKNLDTLNLIFDQLLAARHNRTTTLIALGGGVTGDMTGFAAACYQRGVDFIQVPTTLLAMVDSSVGGKTGVNHALGKNMIGAFYQPNCVLADTDLLKTLPERELSAGIAEVIKYGLISDYDFFVWLEQNMEKLLAKDEAALAYAIDRSCQNKASVVARDEREGGIRAILNFGHTFGHAIETAQGYGVWLHGEAVAAGMVMAADLSQRMGMICKDDLNRLVNMLKQAKLPVIAPSTMTSEDFIALMSVDKKVLDGRLRLVLLQSMGEAVVTSDIDRTLLLQTFSAC
jgi:3-dehydroquinate synthase